MPKLSEPLPASEIAIWERIIHPTGTMARATAQRIVELKFTDGERQRMHELTERNRAGTLSPGAEQELDNLCRVGTTLSLLKSRARQVLRTRRRVSWRWTSIWKNLSGAGLALSANTVGCPSASMICPLRSIMSWRAHGGKTISGNLALSCFPCNRFKGPNLAGIDPRSGRMAKLFHPRRHAWPRHFRWEESILVGLTPVGRARIRVLHINDFLRVSLRTQLVSEGVLKLD